MAGASATPGLDHRRQGRIGADQANWAVGTSVLDSYERRRSLATPTLAHVIVILRWVWTAILRIGAFTALHRWILLSGVLAAVGVVGLVTTVPAATNIALAVVSVVLVVLEVRKHAVNLREIQFVDRPGDPYSDVRMVLKGNPRFEVLPSDLGSCVIDLAVTGMIAQGRVEARLASANYRLPAEIKDAGTAFRRRRIAEVAVYNGHVLGLNTNLGSAAASKATEWELVPGRYWDHLASDILATKDTLHRGLLAQNPGRQLYVDRHGRLRDFADSWLLNAIGTSVLALTTDARVVLVAQSNRNESSRGLLAPSGSGSLERRDLLGRQSHCLRDLAATGALREMAEEAGILEADVERTAFLGFGRWTAKAGKPELFTLASLSIDSHAVRRRRATSADRPYTLGTELVRLNQDVSGWNSAEPASVLEATDPRRLSIPVHLALRLVQLAVAEQGNAAGDIMRSALDILAGEAISASGFDQPRNHAEATSAATSQTDTLEA